MAEATTTKKRSCAARLHELQDEFGYSQKELKEAVKARYHPRVVDLPTWEVESTPEEEVETVYMKNQREYDRYQLANEYLYHKISVAERNKILDRHLGDVEGLVDEACKLAQEWEDPMSFITTAYPATFEDIDKQWNEMHGTKPASEQRIRPSWEIPAELWKKFCKWAKKHPLRKHCDPITAIEERRKKFLKKIRKKAKKNRLKKYDHKRLRMYDPLYRLDTIEEEEMLQNIKNLKQVMKDGQKRAEEFDKFLGKLYETKTISAESMEKYREYTKKVMENSKRRVDKWLEEAGFPKPSPVYYDFGEGNRFWG